MHCFMNWTLPFFTGNRCGIALQGQGYDGMLGFCSQFDYRKTSALNYKTFQYLNKHMHTKKQAWWRYQPDELQATQAPEIAWKYLLFTSCSVYRLTLTWLNSWIYGIHFHNFLNWRVTRQISLRGKNKSRKLRDVLLNTVQWTRIKTHHQTTACEI